MAFVKFITEPESLKNFLHSEDTDIRLIDATWLMPGSTETLSKGCLNGACFFDMDKVAAPHPTLKHMLPPARQFEKFNREHGIYNSDHVVCYDRRGTASAPRLWWTYRMFGHEKVSILNGGLPVWQELGYNFGDYFETNFNWSDYKVDEPLTGVIGFEELKSVLEKKLQIVDARPEGRFYGTTPEPRAGLKSGHMPGAISLPYGSLKEGKKLRNMSDIAGMVGQMGIDLSQEIITTCGSGITASGLALIFHQLGARNVRVYDASWAEWGASNAPIEI